MRVLKFTNKILPELKEVVGNNPADALRKARKLRNKRKNEARKARKQVV
jgi:hypothetical protein